MIGVLNGLAWVATTTWVLALAAANTGRMLHLIKGGDQLERFWRGCARVHQELWIVAPIGLLLMITEHSGERQYLLLFFDLVNAWNWWYLRNWPDDENRWKRRAKKAKDAVKAVAGRLVVVPAGAPS